MEYETHYKYAYDRKKFLDFDSFLKKLYTDSCLNYLMGEGMSASIEESQFALDKIGSYVEAVEEFLAAIMHLGYVEDDQVPDIIRSLEANVKTVGVLPSEREGSLSSTIDGNIMINSHMAANGNLSGQDREALYVYYELGHILHKHFDWEVNKYIKTLVDKEGVRFVTTDTCHSIVNGFSLLSDAICQDVAEEITYFATYRERDRAHIVSSELFEGAVFPTNFDSKGELQGVALRFAHTLDILGLDAKDTEEVVAKKLATESFKPGFVTSIIKNYEDEGMQGQLANELYYMGKIWDATMGRYRLVRSGDSEKISLEMLNKFKDISSRCSISSRQRAEYYK